MPLESEIELLISVFGRKTASYLMLLKDTGARAGEAWNIKWIDLEPNSQTVTIEPEKGSRARQ
ncbi:MAG: site-specific integrase, partial [Candidatus Bathyarchaeia archaeon]